ncbi:MULTISPECIES: hydrogenase 2 operon protein HybA [Anaeromyxobacter]|uniref:hydrogenase 2 operon protein HybA n=1 Tax=Anaeromyxobacter TaxID=161492 RepID=UPI001F5A794A|nr:MULTISPECIES: hydrogenase 2 operon protein HybA [unclassified Anaeromyxobacter]
MPTVSRRTVLGTLGGAAALAAAPAPASARAPKPPHGDDLGLLFDSTRCVGCRGCVARCREANALPEDVKLVDGAPYDAPLDLNDRTLTIIKRTGDGPGDAYVKAQCMHCADPACVSVCMLGALHKGERGVVAYDVDRCVGCRYCQVACPFNVPRFQWSSATPRIVKCELCRHRWREGKGAACAEACPRDAVVFGTRAELRAEAHRRLDAEPGRYRGGVYGEREGGGTGVLVLSALPFTALGLPALGPEPVPALGETIQHGIYQGFVAPVALFGALAWVTWRNRRASGGGEEEP